MLVSVQKKVHIYKFLEMEDLKDSKNICELCSKLTQDCENVTEVFVGMTQIVIPDVLSFLNEDSIVCRNCGQFIESMFNFKSTCLEIEDNLHNYKTAICPEVNLEKLVGLAETGYTNSKICRTCLKVVEDDFFVSVSKNKDSLLHKHQRKCLPELDMDITEQPVLCIDCVEMLQKYFSFLSKTLRPRFKTSLEYTSDSKAEYNEKYALHQQIKFELNTEYNIKAEDESALRYVNKHKKQDCQFEKSVSVNKELIEVDTNSEFYKVESNSTENKVLSNGISNIKISQFNESNIKDDSIIILDSDEDTNPVSVVKHKTHDCEQNSKNEILNELRFSTSNNNSFIADLNSTEKIVVSTDSSNIQTSQFHGQQQKYKKVGENPVNLDSDDNTVAYALENFESNSSKEIHNSQNTHETNKSIDKSITLQDNSCKSTKFDNEKLIETDSGDDRCDNDMDVDLENSNSDTEDISQTVATDIDCYNIPNNKYVVSLEQYNSNSLLQTADIQCQIDSVKNSLGTELDTEADDDIEESIEEVEVDDSLTDIVDSQNIGKQSLSLNQDNVTERLSEDVENDVQIIIDDTHTEIATTDTQHPMTTEGSSLEHRSLPKVSEKNDSNQNVIFTEDSEDVTERGQLNVTNNTNKQKEITRHRRSARKRKSQLSEIIINSDDDSDDDLDDDDYCPEDNSINEEEEEDSDYYQEDNRKRCRVQPTSRYIHCKYCRYRSTSELGLDVHMAKCKGFQLEKNKINKQKKLTVAEAPILIPAVSTVNYQTDKSNIVHMVISNNQLLHILPNGPAFSKTPPPLLPCNVSAPTVLNNSVLKTLLSKATTPQNSFSQYIKNRFQNSVPGLVKLQKQTNQSILPKPNQLITAPNSAATPPLTISSDIIAISDDEEQNNSSTTICREPIREAVAEKTSEPDVDPLALDNVNVSEMTSSNSQIVVPVPELNVSQRETISTNEGTVRVVNIVSNLLLEPHQQIAQTTYDNRQASLLGLSQEVNTNEKRLSEDTETDDNLSIETLDNCDALANDALDKESSNNDSHSDIEIAENTESNKLSNELCSGKNVNIEADKLSNTAVRDDVVCADEDAVVCAAKDAEISTTVVVDTPTGATTLESTVNKDGRSSEQSKNAANELISIEDTISISDDSDCDNESNSDVNDRKKNNNCEKRSSNTTDSAFRSNSSNVNDRKKNNNCEKRSSNTTDSASTSNSSNVNDLKKNNNCEKRSSNTTDSASTSNSSNVNDLKKNNNCEKRSSNTTDSSSTSNSKAKRKSSKSHAAALSRALGNATKRQRNEITYLNDHLINPMILSVFKCACCSFNTRHIKTIETHILTHFSKYFIVDSYKCHTCTVYFSKAISLYHHFTNIHKEYPYKIGTWCVNCASVFLNIWAARKHTKTCPRKHITVKLFKSNNTLFCMYCHYETNEMDSAKNHMKTCNQIRLTTNNAIEIN